MSTYGMGMLSVCPIFILFASRLGFIAISDSSFTEYCREIENGVSPALTTCVRAPAAVRLGSEAIGRLALAARPFPPADTKEFEEVDRRAD